MTNQEIVDAIKNKNTRYSTMLASFVEFMLDEKHYDTRFWQGLCFWSGWGYIYVAKVPLQQEVVDTYYWEDNRTY